MVFKLVSKKTKVIDSSGNIYFYIKSDVIKRNYKNEKNVKIIYYSPLEQPEWFKMMLKEKYKNVKKVVEDEFLLYAMEEKNFFSNFQLYLKDK